MIGAGILALPAEAGAAKAAVADLFLTAARRRACSATWRAPASGFAAIRRPRLDRPTWSKASGRGRLGRASLRGSATTRQLLAATATAAVSFGGYAVSLFIGDNGSSVWNHVFITALLLVMLALNLIGTKVVAAAQSFIVLGVLAVSGRIRLRERSPT